MAMTRAARWSVFGLAATTALMLSACGLTSASGEQGAEDGAGSHGSVRLALVPASADVVGVQYTVTCDDGEVWTQYVALEEEGLPAHVSNLHEGWPFADLFFVTGATSCVIDATPMATPTEASSDCEPASVEVDVTPDETSEVLLVISCTDEASGADVMTLINHAPVIDKVTVTPGLDADLCEEVRIIPAVADADGDEVVLTFALEPPSGGVAIGQAASAKDLAFTPASPGEWLVTILADDPWTTTELLLTVKVQEGEVVCAP